MARSRLNWIWGRLIACWALGLAATAPAVAQQDDGQKRVTTIDHAIELYLSDNALEAQYVRNLDLGDLGVTEAKAGFFYNEDRDLIGMGDLLMNVGDDVGVRALEVRVGTRVYGAFLAPEDQDVLFLAVELITRCSARRADCRAGGGSAAALGGKHEFRRRCR